MPDQNKGGSTKTKRSLNDFALNAIPSEYFAPAHIPT
jgi:hypothetical protein